MRHKGCHYTLVSCNFTKVLTNFQHSKFTVRHSSKLVKFKLQLKIPLHLKCITTPPCEISDKFLNTGANYLQTWNISSEWTYQNNRHQRNTTYHLCHLWLLNESCQNLIDCYVLLRWFISSAHILLAKNDTAYNAQNKNCKQCNSSNWNVINSESPVRHDEYIQSKMQNFNNKHSTDSFLSLAKCT